MGIRNVKQLVWAFVGLGGSSVLGSCSSSDEPPPAAAAGSCDDIDYAAYKTAAPVSFSKDVMPVFGFSCTASPCHNHDDKALEADLDLGVKCKYDQITKICSYPAAPVASQTLQPQPLTAEIIAAVYKELTEETAATVTSPTITRVIKGDPANSFLIQKMTGTQNDHPGYTCDNQDTVRADGRCGDSMPARAPRLCEGTFRPRFDVVAAWIAQGAQND